MAVGFSHRLQGIRATSARRTILVCLILVLASIAKAGVILPATSTPYRLVFVTAESHDSKTESIDPYNTFANAEASMSSSLPSGLTWTIIGSTRSVDARTNTLTRDIDTSYPIYNTQGFLVANNNADLWDGTIANPIAYDQEGRYVNTAVFTGTNDTGGIGRDGFWGSVSTLGCQFLTSGLSDTTTNQWVHAGVNIRNSSLDGTARFYAISSPIPEPATLFLLTLACPFLLRGRPRFAKEKIKNNALC